MIDPPRVERNGGEILIRMLCPPGVEFGSPPISSIASDELRMPGALGPLPGAELQKFREPQDVGTVEEWVGEGAAAGGAEQRAGEGRRRGVEERAGEWRLGAGLRIIRMIRPRLRIHVINRAGIRISRIVRPGIRIFRIMEFLRIFSCNYLIASGAWPGPPIRPIS